MIAEKMQCGKFGEVHLLQAFFAAQKKFNKAVRIKIFSIANTKIITFSHENHL